jgi:hypothetical protein
VSAGDVYRLWRQRPRVIGIVDGRFDCVPAVWHKEIMWVMERGVHVFGSASMGALRAAELDRFGMRGVGWVYQSFREGALSRDDEVAVKHEEAEDGYRPLSEAMVDIRRTLQAAERQGIISAATCDILTVAGTTMFYQDRTWPHLIQAVSAAGAYAVQLDALRRWLPTGRVAQQADDAVAMLRKIRSFLATDPAPQQVNWSMANTAIFEAAKRRAVRMVINGGIGPALMANILDEIRLLGPGSFEAARCRGLLRVFAADFAERAGMTIEGDRLQEAVAEFRLKQGLDRGAGFARFLAANDLSVGDFERLVVTDEMVNWACGRAERETLVEFLDNLRVRGEYTRLVAKARAKLDYHEPPANPEQEQEALQWYLAERHGTPAMDDLAGYAQSCGFADEQAFRRAVWHEYQYTCAQ